MADEPRDGELAVLDLMYPHAVEGESSVIVDAVESSPYGARAYLHKPGAGGRRTYAKRSPAPAALTRRVRKPGR